MFLGPDFDGSGLWNSSLTVSMVLLPDLQHLDIGKMRIHHQFWRVCYLETNLYQHYVCVSIHVHCLRMPVVKGAGPCWCPQPKFGCGHGITKGCDLHCWWNALHKCCLNSKYKIPAWVANIITYQCACVSYPDISLSCIIPWIDACIYIFMWA